MKKTTEPGLEVRTFKIHQRMLMDVIKRQAGTLAKAVLEAVMNAADAKATQCRITLTGETMEIEDDGKGMSPDEVRRLFEVFGQPHEEAEGKVFGTFRMGRGQIFAFGRNTWETSVCRMEVDVNRTGLDYYLETDRPDLKGCRISVALYEKLLPSGLAETEASVARWVKYAPCKVYWNGKLISRDPISEKWTHETPEAYIRLGGTGNLDVYNLGIHTVGYPDHQFGTGGVIVSKQQLKVNFARNDIQHDCPVWRKIKPLVNKVATDTNKKKTKLDNHERQRFIDQFLSGELGYYEFLALKVFELVSGRFCTGHSWWYGASGNCITICDVGDHVGDKIAENRLATVLSTGMLRMFRVDTLQELVDVIAEKVGRPSNVHVTDFEQLKASVGGDYQIIPEKEHTPNQILWLKLIRKAATVWYDRSYNKTTYLKTIGQAARARVVRLGRGPAWAWTDGVSSVTITAEFLDKQEFDERGFTNVAAILLHELCHGDRSDTTHVHSSDFYRDFHDCSLTLLGDFSRTCVMNLPAMLDQAGRAVTKKMLKTQDKQAAAKDKLAEFEGRTAALSAK